MKKILTYISAIIMGVLLGTTYAFAQDTSDVQLNLEVDSGCNWTGTPYAPTSSLTVADNEICIIAGTGREALDVQVDEDTDGLGQAGGKLIVGGLSTNTDFTVGGDFYADGIVEIGQSGNPAYTSSLILNGTFTISNSGDDGDVTVVSNTNGDNVIDINTILNIGLSGNQFGTLTLNDDATTSAADDIEMYGTLNVASGTFTSNDMIDVRGSGVLDNDSILNSADDLRLWDTSSADNSGTLNMTAAGANIYVGYNFGGTVSMTNTGTINADNLNGTVTVYYDNILTNNGGTINTYDMDAAAASGSQSATINNGSSGDINISNNLTLNSQAAFNNNSGSTTVTGTTYIHSNQSTKAGRSTLTNSSGATFQSAQIELGDSGGTYYGGNLNNDGTLTIPTGAATGLYVRRGGTYTNQSNGTSSIVPDVDIDGNSGTNEDSSFVNQNTTTDAVDIDGAVTMLDYADIDNSGSMRVDGTDNIIIGTDNTTPETLNSTITNQTGGTLNLNGTNPEVFDEDLTVTNDGTLNVASDLTLNDTASVTSAGNTDVDSTGNGRTSVFATSSFTNEGNFDTYELYVGDDGSTTEGGTFTNQGASGTVDVTYTGTDSVIIYRGAIINNSTYGYQSPGEGSSFFMDGRLKIVGVSGDTSYFQNTGVVEHDDRMEVFEYGLLDLDGGRWVTTGSYTNYVHNRGVSAADAIIEVASGTIYSAYYTYIGDNNATGAGNIVNYGEIKRVDPDGQDSSSQLLLSLYNDNSQVDNYGYIRRNNIYLYDATIFYNRADGVMEPPGSYGTTYVYGDSTFHNYGTFKGSQLRVGYGSTDGGTFNNYYNSTAAMAGMNPGVNLHLTDPLYIADGGLFDNKTDAEIYLYSVNLGNTTTSNFIQRERTTSSDLKTHITGNLQINNYGTAEIYDTAEIGGMSIASGGNYYQKAGATASNSYTTSSSSITINGYMEIDEGTRFDANNSTFLNSTGEMLNNGTFYCSSYIYVDGDYRSGINSMLDADGFYPRIVIGDGANAGTAEIAGATNADIEFDHDNGDLCFGSWDTWPSPTDCTNNTNSHTIGSIDADGGDIEMANNVTVTIDDVNIASGSQMTQDSTSYLQINNDHNLIARLTGSSVTSNGHMDIQGSGAGNHGYIMAEDNATISLNYTGADYDIGSVEVNDGATITTAASTILNLNDTHSSNLSGTLGVPAIVLDDNVSTAGTTATFQTYGTVNLNSGSTQNLIFGYTDTSYGTGELVVDAGGSVQHTNGSSGNVYVNESGRLEVVNDGNADLDADFNGTITVDGNYVDATPNRGVYAGGQLECQTNLTVNSTGFMDVGAYGDVTVAGSTTDVYGDVELDGTLNSGDLTVYSGGVISSGDGNPDVSGSGCGIGGNFGCGTTTNFYINATSVDVQSGGNISSDFVSDVDRTGTGGGGGSHGGEGVDISSSPTSTLGSTKPTTPDYGERGESNTGAASAYAGGGVNMNVTGDITINGVVSADGATGGSTGTGESGGAGGTVIITHNPSATTAVFTGSGEITAEGGDGTYPGGGGRISIDSPLLDDPDFGSYDFGEATAGTVSALGGDDTSSIYAATGTVVYLGDDHNANDTLIIDQGGNSPSANSQTDLTDAPTFDRIEVTNSADADLSGATVATACYNISSTVTGTTTCDATTDMPDKPDSLHIQTSSNGTSSGDATEEPGYIAGKGNGVSDTAYDVADLTPVFAMYFRNPGDTTTGHSVIEIQVDDNADFSSPVWDATFGGADGEITLDTPVTDGDWTEDIEYAGSTLSLSTTYYVRARFREGSGAAGYNPGLWTHADYNNQYKFIITSYTELFVDNCNGEAANTNVVLTQDGTTTGADLSIISGGRYAYGACDLNFSTSESDWEVYLSMDSGETEFNHVTYPTQYEIAHIDNANNDCLLDTTGTGTEQEFGFNLTTYPLGTAGEQLADANVTSNSDCRLDTSTYPEACGNTGTEGYYKDTTCFFNVEPLASRDTIIDTTGSSINDGRVTATFHANVGDFEAAGDYDVIVEATITANP